MGKIGKPQKSNKNKKLKKTFDTEGESDERIGKARSKLHNLPVGNNDLDRQDMPRKVQEMFQRKDMSKAKTKKKKQNQRRRVKEKLEYGMERPFKPVKEFVQGKRENNRRFMQRVELEAKRAIMVSQMEDKYKVDFTQMANNNNKNNKKGGAVANKDGNRKKLNKTERKQAQSFEQKLLQTKKPRSERKREKARERKKQKLTGAKLKKLDRATDFSALKDVVQFGEVAMEPPSLSRPRKADQDDSKPRPGKRSLLLKEMMEGSKSTGTDTSNNTAGSSEPVIHKPAVKSKAQRPVGQTMKRKFLSPVQQQITDFERQNAIELYREMKDRKYQQKNFKIGDT